tara:strand:- start:4021 stop:4497 length:477 start_codon:yes stop_codon:yes gene_type:complete
MADTQIVKDIEQQKRLDKKEIDKDRYNVLITEDERLEYICGSKGFNNDIKNYNKEYTPLDKIDYSIGNKEVETKKNLSYLQVKTIDEGIEWYRNFDSKIPEELLPVMARWNWGDLSSITKKQIKNENKKDKKNKKKKEKRGITITKSTKENPVILNFD